MTDHAKRAGSTLKCHWCGNQLLPNNLEIRCEICSEQFTLDHICGFSGVAAECERLKLALRSLAKEASGFLGMADHSAHGYTNMAVLRGKIDEALNLSKEN